MSTPTKQSFAESMRMLEQISDAIDKVNMLKGADKSTNPVEKKRKYRNFEDAEPTVKQLYSEQHVKQTVEFNLKIREEFKHKTRGRMSVWDAIMRLNTVIDQSDPDTDRSQLDHLLQTAEAIRKDGHPDWMQLTGLLHDLGKILLLFGADGQWDVVGDTFVVGCKYSNECIYPETFKRNPDAQNPLYNTEYGIYEPHCGLENVLLSWGHDEYLYNVLKDQCSLPTEALAMIRYHSFYPWHEGNGYQHLMNEADQVSLRAVRLFNPYDLYSKDSTPVDADELRPYYQGLIAKYFPAEIDW